MAIPNWLNPDKHPFRYVSLRSAQDWSKVPDGAERYEVHFRNQAAISHRLA
jgi:hypothetical protein